MASLNECLRQRQVHCSWMVSATQAYSVFSGWKFVMASFWCPDSCWWIENFWSLRSSCWLCAILRGLIWRWMYRIRSWGYHISLITTSVVLTDPVLERATVFLLWILEQDNVSFLKKTVKNGPPRWKWVFFNDAKLSPVLHKILPLAPVPPFVPRMRMGVYYGFMQPSYLWHFQECRFQKLTTKNGRTFYGVFTAIAGHGRGRKI